jgi:glycerol-3-phosphate acyltransferase PlsX|tara:strand:- start:5479 stop:6492 length:1014 start_codon:yes stop_codon:yes gene_type:complete
LNKLTTIAIDAMGGDFGPSVTIKGLAKACSKVENIHANIYGDEKIIAQHINKYSNLRDNTKIFHSNEVVPMDVKPIDALRKIGKESSMWSSIESVSRGESEAVLSAGNTGALMALSKIILKTVSGIERPAITALWPNPEGDTVVLDLGANVDVSPNQLVQFGIMGYAYAVCVLKKDNPKVAILNIGHEDTKGTEDLKIASEKLSAIFKGDYIGFVEGDDLSLGKSDVIITDGFTGNIALKTAEGIAKLLSHYMSTIFKSSLRGKIGMIIAKNSFLSLKEKMDPRGNNGGFFLGLNGLVIKSHGGADATSFAKAIEFSINLARSNISKKIEDLIGINI